MPRVNVHGVEIEGLMARVRMELERRIEERRGRTLEAAE
jgi:hypothetical protein